jgi:SAM-dependent methyltransferase
MSRRFPTRARALDLGCAVGRSTFELARHCEEVLGIDFSKRFVDAASRLVESGCYEYQRTNEGNLRTTLRANVPGDIDRKRVRFEAGDAMNPRRDLGGFDVVLMANLIDRLREPARALSHLACLVKAGGQLIITSPYTWLPEFTPPAIGWADSNVMANVSRASMGCTKCSTSSLTSKRSAICRFSSGSTRENSSSV